MLNRRVSDIDLTNPEVRKKLMELYNDLITRNQKDDGAGSNSNTSNS